MKNNEHQMSKKTCQKTDRNSVTENTLINAIPNGTTIAAIKEARTAIGKKTFDSIESLMAELRN